MNQSIQNLPMNQSIQNLPMNQSIQILHSITPSIQRIKTIPKPRKKLPQSGRAIAVPFEINQTTSFARSAGFRELVILKTNR